MGSGLDYNSSAISLGQRLSQNSEKVHTQNETRREMKWAEPGTKQ